MRWDSCGVMVGIGKVDGIYWLWLECGGWGVMGIVGVVYVVSCGGCGVVVRCGVYRSCDSVVDVW